MELLNKKCYVEYTVLSPLHVGAGAEKDLVCGIDYVESEGFLYKINLRKMVEAGIDVKVLPELFEKKNENGIKKIIANKLDVVSDYKIKMPLSIAKSNDIKAFFRNELENEPIIPGSSLKGAVRSVLFSYFNEKTKKIRKPIDKIKETEIFGSADDGSEYMRFWKFSDIAFDKTVLYNTKIFNLHKKDGSDSWVGGWKKEGKKTEDTFSETGFNTLYEVLPVNSSSISTIMVSDKAFSNFYRENFTNINQKNVINGGIKALFGIINEHTLKYIDKEIAFFEKYNNNETDEIIENLNVIKNCINKRDDSCVIKMSAGSGFHSITGDWQYSDYSKTGVNFKTGKQNYKSRKVSVSNDGFSLMGFIELKIVSEEKLLIEKRKKEQIEQERQMLLDLLDNARESYEKNDDEKALSLYQKVHDLDPNNVEVSNVILKLEEELKKTKLEEDIKLAQQKELIEREKANNCSLKDRLRNANNIKTAIGNTKTWLKYNELTEQATQEFIDKQREIISNMKPKDKKACESYGKWKELESIFGVDKAENIYHKIIEL